MNNNDKKLKELLEKWHSGDFNRTDEQALQRLIAESDEFGRTSTEGYLSLPEENHQARLEVIRKKLAQKDQPSSALWPRLAVAASILLAVGSIWWLNSDRDQPSEDLAQHSTAPISTPNLSDADLPIQPEVISGDNKKSAAQPKRALDSVVLYTTTSDLATSGAVKRKADSSSDGGIAPSTDLEITAPLVSSPPTPPAAETLGKQSANAASQNKPSAPSMGNEKAAKKARTSNMPLPIPANGWEAFRKSMAKELMLTNLAKDAGLKNGTVSMILDINPSDGQVKTVLFINKLGYGCDELAEQFVRKNNWIIRSGGSTQIEVELEFKF